ncbi:hypothetical protein HMPREF1548_00457 [Clostridium sp. KLE 1755]|jgi:hypothetical protein|nr:hypothetical protein HMPREF1548_00457 [Clostridium sp. KLE 1755]
MDICFGSYVVDANSTLGILAIGINKSMIVCIYDEMDATLKKLIGEIELKWGRIF